MASAYLAARRVDAAIDVLERGVDRHPTFRLWWLLAGAYYEREDFEKALTAFEQCNRCNPKNARAFLMKGYCALQLDQLETAETAFTEAARFPCQNKEAQQPAQGTQGNTGCRFQCVTTCYKTSIGSKRVITLLPCSVWEHQLDFT